MQKLSTTSVRLDYEKREQLRQDALTSWNHYQATGLHVTAKEADAWLERLENCENPPTPECRV